MEFSKDDTKKMEGGTNSCGVSEREMGNGERWDTETLKRGKECQTHGEENKEWQVEERGEEEEKRGKRVADTCEGEEGMAGSGKGEEGKRGKRVADTRGGAEEMAG